MFWHEIFHLKTWTFYKIQLSHVQQFAVQKFLNNITVFSSLQICFDLLLLSTTWTYKKKKYI